MASIVLRRAWSCSWNRINARNAKIAASLLLFYPSLLLSDWLTFGHDPQRSGWSFEENKLTPTNVGDLELKWQVQLRNQFLALNALTAPVVATDVATPQGIKTLVYVAGSSNHLFAIDTTDGKVVWDRTFESHIVAKGEPFYLCPNAVNATPTIDRSGNTIYAIAMDGRLYGMDLGTGKVQFGPFQFVPPFSKSWSLNLRDGAVYTATSQGCGGDRSGLYSMDVKNPMHHSAHELLVRRGFGGGIWGRGGPVVGKNGLIYIATGDGVFNPATGDFGSSFIAASAHKLELIDFYTPLNWREVNKSDLDIPSGGHLWFAHKNYNIVVGGGKESVVYLLDADSLGGKDHQTPLFVTTKLANDGNALEEKGMWGAPALWKDERGDAWVYVTIWGAASERAPKFPETNGPTPHGSIMAFRVLFEKATNSPYLEPAWVSPDFNLPDPPVIANGVLFALSTGENPRQDKVLGILHFKSTEEWKKNLLTTEERSAGTRPAVLYALDAKTGKMLYQSSNAMKSWVHFSGLAIDSGKVFAVDHDSRLYCFGLKEKQP